MIHRIEPGYLHTNDALNKRQRRQAKRRLREPVDSHRDEAAQTDRPARQHDRPALQQERESVVLDLVA